MCLHAKSNVDLDSKILAMPLPKDTKLDESVSVESLLPYIRGGIYTALVLVGPVVALYFILKLIFTKIAR